MSKRSKLFAFSVFYPLVIFALHTLSNRLFTRLPLQLISFMGLLSIAKIILLNMLDYLIGFSAIKTIIEPSRRIGDYLIKRNVIIIAVVSVCLYFMDTILAVVFRLIMRDDSFSLTLPIGIGLCCISAMVYLGAMFLIYQKTFEAVESLSQLYRRLFIGINGVIMWAIIGPGIFLSAFTSYISYSRMLSGIDEASLLSYINMLSPRAFSISLFCFVNYAVFLSIGISNVNNSNLGK